jgi:CHAT domain-containing protein
LPAQAAAAIDTAERALPGVQDPNLRAEWTATVTLARGHLAVATAPSAAVPLLTDAYAYFTRHQTAFRLASILLDRGRAFRATGKPAEARRDWDAAASIIEDQQPAVRVEQLRVSRFNALWDVFAELERADKTDAAAGLASSERARARALLDSLAPDQRAVPLAGAALWTWLPPDTAAVVYSVLPEELLVWIVDRSGPRLREVPITAGALDALVGQALDGIAAGQVEDLRPLSALLLRDLPPGRPDATLLIVPDGPLHFLPFAALPLPGTSARLVETWTPVVTPSLSVARTLAQRVGARAAGSHVLLVGYEGDAASGLPLLRGVDRELEALRQAYPRAEVLRGSAATADAFARAAATSALIHVAAHGVLNLAYPSRSHILLAGPPDAQPLTAPRIAALTLEANPTVVLTACDAARGRVYRGEGQLSLARPFLIAGAASVIAAQMPVSDVTAPAFDADLAVRLTHDRDGPRALAAVQRAWIARHAPERDWAVFSVMGSIEPGRQVTRWQ